MRLGTPAYIANHKYTGGVEDKIWGEVILIGILVCEGTRVG